MCIFSNGNSLDTRSIDRRTQNIQYDTINPNNIHMYNEGMDHQNSGTKIPPNQQLGFMDLLTDTCIHVHYTNNILYCSGLYANYSFYFAFLFPSWKD